MTHPPRRYDRMPGYMIELDLTGKLAIVVGLGRVGRRRAAGLLEAGARVVGIDPAAPDVAAVEVIADAYRREHLDRRPALVVAAATPEVNRRVVADARSLGLLVNSASEPASGDFRVSAAWRSGGLAVGVSTGGASPALARTIRDQIARAIGPEPGALALILARLRPMALERLTDPEARRRLMKHWGDRDWLDLLAREGPIGVKRAVVKAIREAERGDR